MARLIDADALKARIESCTEEKDWLVSQYNADWIWSMLDSAPTIDAEPVVRCGECSKKLTEKCALHCGQLNETHFFVQRDDNFFCGEGKRRDSDG